VPAAASGARPTRFSKGFSMPFPSFAHLPFRWSAHSTAIVPTIWFRKTIMKAWAHRTSFAPGTNLNAWLHTILRNEFYSQMRRNKREVEDREGVYSSKLAVVPE
jgi:hypothetical protein